MSIQKKATKFRRGVAVMEFTFSLLFLIPLFLGIFIFGFKFVRSLEMTQITRDLAAMYLKGVDFRALPAQQTAQALAQTFNMTATGTSVTILSKVKLITAGDCAVANLELPKVAGTDCSNKDKIVFVEQLTIGNPTAGQSAFGTPPLEPDTCTTFPGCKKTVTIKNQGRNTLAQATNFAMVLRAGEFAYVAEMVNLTTDLNIPGLSAGPQVYARAIF